MGILEKPSILKKLSDIDTSLGENTHFINVKAFGAKGDGVTDDATTIQSAIDYCIDNNKSLYFPRGKYRTTKGLEIDDENNTKDVNNFIMFGESESFNYSPGGNIKGTQIICDSVGDVTSILSITRGYQINVSDINLFDKNGNIENGICLPNDEYTSEFTFKNIRIFNVSRGIASLRTGATSKNSEFHTFENILCHNVDIGFYSEASQGYGVVFRRFYVGLKDSGIGILLSNSTYSAGYGLFLYDAYISGVNVASINNTTFLKTNSSNSPINIIGGRNENLTNIITYGGGSESASSPICFLGVEFDGLTSSENYPTITSNYGNDLFCNSKYSINFKNCRFNASSQYQNLKFKIELYKGDRSNVYFENCMVESFIGNPSIVVPSFVKQSGNVEFYKTYISPKNMSKHIEYSKKVGVHNIFSGNDSRRSYKGVPNNILIHPNFTDSTGNGISVASPWVSNSTVNANNFINSPNFNFSMAPFSKEMAIPANTTIYQDLNVNLSETEEKFVQYQCSVCLLGGSRFRFALVNSADTSIVYDEVIFSEFGGGENDELYPRHVQLLAYAKGTGQFRLMIQTGSYESYCKWFWQLASEEHDASFSFSRNSAITIKEYWENNSSTSRIFGRLAIPCKTDEYGSNNSTLTSDVDECISDLYVSKNTNKLKYRCNGKWYEITGTEIV